MWTIAADRQCAPLAESRLSAPGPSKLSIGRQFTRPLRQLPTPSNRSRSLAATSKPIPVRMLSTRMPPGATEILSGFFRQGLSTSEHA
jgi:hypothetical protein